jgi:hypothetical protein
MESIFIPSFVVVVAFVVGALVGYGIRALISARHRAKARRRRHFFDDN